MKKVIAGTAYHLYGPNAELLKWATHSISVKGIIEQTGLNDESLFKALSKHNP